MRINTNVAALGAHRNLFNTQREVDSSMARLSSGLRIARAGDDAAGLAIANNLRASHRSLTQASNNAEQANAFLSIAEGSASTIEKILERQRELVMQRTSDNNADADVQAALLAEFDNLGAEVTRIIAATQFNGSAVFDAGAKNFVVGDTGTAASDEIGITVNAPAALALTGAANMADVSFVDAQLTAVNDLLGDIGSAQNRLDYTISNLKNSIVNLSAAESVIRDVDMASEMAKFSKNNVLAQAGTAMLAQANQSAQGVLQLLR